MSSLLPYLLFALVLYGFVLAYRWRRGGNAYCANRDGCGPVGGNFVPGSIHASSSSGGGWYSGDGCGGGFGGDGGGGGGCG